MAKKTGASRRPTLAVREKGQQAIKLRMAGATTKQIATQLGYASESGAYKAIMRELGDTGAISTALRIQERRASLLGLDAPKQIEARVRIDVMSWNQAIRDFIEVYRTYHRDSPEAAKVLDSLDKLAQDRFAGVTS